MQGSSIHRHRPEVVWTTSDNDSMPHPDTFIGSQVELGADQRREELPSAAGQSGRSFYFDDEGLPDEHIEARESIPNEELARCQTTWFVDSSESDAGEHASSEDESPMTQATSRSTSAADSAIDIDEAAVDTQKAETNPDNVRERCPDAVQPMPSVPEELDMDDVDATALVAVPAHRAHATIVLGRGKPPQVVPGQSPLVCGVCSEVFEQDNGELLSHLRDHLDTYRGEAYCKKCKIGFVHQADFDRHVLAARTIGHCGFPFDHQVPCNGHHAPDQDPLSKRLTEWDSFRLCVQLRDWERSQLLAYIASINDLVAARNARSSVCYSVEALLRRPSRTSLSSYAISMKTLGSAPADRTADGKLDIGGLSQRLRKMSLQKSGSQLKQTVKKASSIVQAGGLNRGLYEAACAGEVARIRQLVSAGADPTAVLGGRCVLSAAAHRAPAATVQELIDLGARVDGQDIVYGSALGSAAFVGNMETVTLLLAAGANPDQPGGKMGSPLSSAAAKGMLSIVEVLVRHGANVNTSGGENCTALISASRSGQLQVVKYLLAKGADPNGTFGTNTSPLCSAISRGYVGVATVLADGGADLNAHCNQHGTPVFTAVNAIAENRCGLEILHVLLDRKADVNQQDGHGFNALRLAASHADHRHMPSVVQLLIDNHAEVHGSGSRGSALHWAKKRKQHHIEKRFFLKAGEEEDANDDAYGRCIAVILMLRKEGATDELSPSGGPTTEELIARLF